MRYQVHRIKDLARESFRWSAHTGGTAILKLKDYEPAEQWESATPYAVWKLAAELGKPLHPGDVLEPLDDSRSPRPLLIAKYIGFEPAEWFVPTLSSPAPQEASGSCQ